MTEITHNQAVALAGLIHELRPDWDAPGVLAVLGNTRTRADRADLAIAAIRAAVVPTNRTPAIIGMDGPHWRNRDAEPPPPPLPKLDRCRACRLKHDPGTPCGTVREDLSEHAAAGLAEARQALADIHDAGILCGHGVPRTNCNEHHTNTDAEAGTEAGTEAATA